MFVSTLKNNFSLQNTVAALLLCFAISSCNITRNAPKGKPYLAKNSFEIKGGKFNKLEQEAVLARMENQLDDSSKLNFNTSFLFFTTLKRPPAYDSIFSFNSAENMRTSMVHIGYYQSKVSYKADTIGKKVKVHYTLEPGKATLVDTFRYRLAKPALQELAIRSYDKSLIVKGSPVNKAAILSEISRMVDTFRNNGYYKFTTSELRMRGDTSIEALTSIFDDPFEQMKILAEAQAKRDSPEIKLQIVLNNPDDSTRLNQYTIRHIYLLMDYYPNDNLTDTTNINQRSTRNFILRYHQNLFRTGFLARNILLRPGNLFRQDDYNNTLSKLSKTAQWQSINIQVREVKDSNLVDLVFEMIPEKKFAFEASTEASYSANTSSTNAISGNLVGLSLNLKLANRNINREGIRMTHHLRAGIELNNNSKLANGSLVNSNEISYGLNVTIPRRYNFNPFAQKEFTANRRRRIAYKPGESFVNGNIALTNRFNLFNLQTFTFNIGQTAQFTKGLLNNWKWVFRPVNVEYNLLYNKSARFDTIILENPFLRYSYNTSFVLGMAAGLSRVYAKPANYKKIAKETSINLNIEESGLTWGLLPIFNTYKAKFIKTDAEYKYSINFPKKSIVLRAFVGVGVPLGRDTSLPFIKQYFGGGSNSMRGWPIRGIGAGSQPLSTYSSSLFNDRRGDMQIEFNGEYRYNIARIIPNVLTLKGALFVDIGNVWNFKNSKTDGTIDSTQFKFGNLYKQLGMSAGTGLRLDFNYIELRLDFGFRIKRPETSYENNGWKLPPINGVSDLFKKIFTRGANDEYRRWRYENFNFSIGIGVPF
ncbi:MAG TPA: BamA/TamA family outer membrane protein [Ferruginibacter sp.]|nr:BamA/TamA family outer membrane protein [Ferruginibacter sp.]HRE63962.1 BamA/TamA family outer membrane protein [Ferruginibacter sp.]